MANNQKNSLPAPKKGGGSASKKTQSAAPERDPYAYYDELYEKNPRKKKKADEKLPPYDYEKYDESPKSSKNEPKKRSKRKPIQIEDELLDIDLTPPSSKTLHRLMPYNRRRDGRSWKSSAQFILWIFRVACILYPDRTCQYDNILAQIRRPRHQPQKDSLWSIHSSAPLLSHPFACDRTPL